MTCARCLWICLLSFCLSSKLVHSSTGDQRYMNLAGQIDTAHLGRLVRKTCGNMRWNCSWYKCDCAFSLPPEIDLQRPHGLARLDHQHQPDIAQAKFRFHYLDLVKRIVIGSFEDGYSMLYASPNDHRKGHPSYYVKTGWDNELTLTVSTYVRLNNVQRLLEDVIARSVPGDFIEAGVWRGGVTAVAIAVFKAYEQFPTRKVFAADSFEGLPGLDIDELSQRGAKPGIGDAEMAGTMGVSLKQVKQQLEKLGLLEPNVHFIKGFFKPALYEAVSSGQFANGFSVIRLDGDTYMSTIQSLEALYPLLHPSGYVIIDDYTIPMFGCRQAVDEYRWKNNITSPLIPVSHAGFGVYTHRRGFQVDGVWWQKP